MINTELDLKFEIKALIIETLNIQDVDPKDVIDNIPLFGGDNVIVLDSIDALEIIMVIQRKYKVRIDDQNLARSILLSIDSIADFITTKQAESIA
jgi:acyl carrier protein